MNIHLPEELKSIRAEEVEIAMEELIKDTVKSKSSAYWTRTSGTAKQFPGFATLLGFEPDEENPGLGKGKVEGYRWAICLIAAVAGNRRSAGLRNALASITSVEMIDAFCEVIEGGPADFVDYLVKQSEDYCGFCGGCSRAFAFLSESKRLDQMAMGHTILCGTLLKVANARDALALRWPPLDSF